MRALLEGTIHTDGDSKSSPTAIGDYRSLSGLGPGLRKTESFALGDLMVGLDEEGEAVERPIDVPVPLVLCVAGALMHLIATGDSTPAGRYSIFSSYVRNPVFASIKWSKSVGTPAGFLSTRQHAT